MSVDGVNMSEELQMKDLELKEMFIKQEFDRLVDELNLINDSDVLLMNQMNWEIVKKYFDLGREDLIRKHLSFVAYTSFLTEYAGKRELYEEQDYQARFQLFQEIYEMLSRG